MKSKDCIRAVRIPFSIPLGKGKSLERFAYSYLILGHGVGIVDCGAAGSWPAIEAALGHAGRSAAEVSHAIITHSHPDHIGGLPTVRDKTSCLVAAPIHEIPWITNVHAQYKVRPIPGFHELVEGPTTVDIPLSHEDLVEIDPIRLCALSAPGHSPEQMVFRVEPCNALISADAIPRPGDPPIYEDARATAETIRTLMAMGPFEALYSSWDEPRFGLEVLTAMKQGLEVIAHMHARVRAEMKKTPAATPMDIAPRVFIALGIPPVPLAPPILNTIQSHMDLVDEDIV